MCGRAGALGESQGEQAYVRKRERDYVWMKPGTLRKFRVYYGTARGNGAAGSPASRTDPAVLVGASLPRFSAH